MYTLIWVSGWLIRAYHDMCINDFIAWTNVPRKQGGLGSINIPLG